MTMIVFSMKKTFVYFVFFTSLVTALGQGKISLLNLSGPVSYASTGELVGPEIVGQLWAGDSPDALAPVGEPIPFVGEGIILGGELYVPGIPQGQRAYIQLRAWDGEYKIMSEAYPLFGLSEIVVSKHLAGGHIPGPVLNTPPFAIGIPEPSAALLTTTLGAAILFFIVAKRHLKHYGSG